MILEVVKYFKIFGLGLLVKWGKRQIGKWRKKGYKKMKNVSK